MSDLLDTEYMTLSNTLIVSCIHHDLTQQQQLVVGSGYKTSQIYYDENQWINPNTLFKDIAQSINEWHYQISCA